MLRTLSAVATCAPGQITSPPHTHTDTRSSRPPHTHTGCWELGGSSQPLTGRVEPGTSPPSRAPAALSSRPQGASSRLRSCHAPAVPFPCTLRCSLTLPPSKRTLRPRPSLRPGQAHHEAKVPSWGWALALTLPPLSVQWPQPQHPRLTSGDDHTPRPPDEAAEQANGGSHGGWRRGALRGLCRPGPPALLPHSCKE